MQISQVICFLSTQKLCYGLSLLPLFNACASSLCNIGIETGLVKSSSLVISTLMKRREFTLATKMSSIVF